jgi:hypothetical protein
MKIENRGLGFEIPDSTKDGRKTAIGGKRGKRKN